MAQQGRPPPKPLSQLELDACRDAFIACDTERRGSIDVFDMGLVLEAMGARPTELELFTLISSVDARCRGRLSFGEFLRVIELQHAARARGDEDGDMIDAFVVCGGRPDRTGCVQRDTLVKLIKQDFGLACDIERRIDDLADTGAADGALDFAAFKSLLVARPVNDRAAAGAGARRPS